MAKENKNLQSPIKGMNSDAHPSQLSAQEFPFLLNGNFNDELGGNIIQQEHSNILCTRFSEGTYVINTVVDYSNNRTFYFTANPTTGCSEIGFISMDVNTLSVEDVDLDCGCDIVTNLETPLHLQAQVPTCNYTTLISDCECQCEVVEPNKCLNFNLKYPISSHLHNTKTGTNIYFTDDLNGRRKVEVDSLEQYYTKTVNCDKDYVDCDGLPVPCDCGVKEIPVCINCEKLLLQKEASSPKLEYKGEVNGGQIRHGVYVFYVAYSDKNGNELSRYESPTDDIFIKDRNRSIYIQPELDARVNISLKFSVTDLDHSFEYFKVAVLQRTSLDGTASYYEVGTFPIGTNEILYSGENEKKRLTVEQVIAHFPKYTNAKYVEEANKMLFFSNLQAQPDINLQPIVSLMGQFLKWRTVMAEEDIYNDSKLTASHRSHMRDEVEPISIRFTGAGFVTPNFPFIGRIATDDDLYFDDEHKVDPQGVVQEILDTDEPQSTWKKDVHSILSNGGKCDSQERYFKWQFYNTASVLGDLNACGSDAVGITYVDKVYTKSCESLITGQQVDTVVLTGFEEGEQFTTIYEYVRDHQDYFIKETDSGNDLSRFIIDDYLDENLCCDNEETLFLPDPNYSLLPGEPGYNNDSFSLCSDITYSTSYMELLNIAEQNPPVVPAITYQAEADYDENGAPNQCNMFKVDSSGDIVNLNEYDDSLTTEKTDAWSYWRYVGIPNSGTATVPKKKYWVFEREDNATGGTSCTTASILSIDSQYQLSTFMSPMYANGTTGTDLISTKTSTSIATSGGRIKTSFCGAIGPLTTVSYSSTYPLFVGKNAQWFSVQNITLDEIVINISEMTNPPTGAKNKDCLWYSDNIRVSIYDGCGTSATLLLVKSVTLSDGDIIVMTTPMSGEVYIAIDTPIVTPSQGQANGSSDDDDPTVGMFPYLAPTAGCFSVNVYSPNVVQVEYTSDSVVELRQTCEFTANCPTKVYDEIRCNPVPWQEGEFAYTESTEIYPNNEYLYDSSYLKIPEASITGLPHSGSFIDAFTDGTDEDGNYNLNGETDFRCKNIRHFKFPDNIVAPITDGDIGTGQNPAFQPNKVFPLGIHLDNEVINTFLDIAALPENNLITQEIRNSITGYEIFKGDTRLSRTVIGKGLIYDMYKYKEHDKDMFFSNFPYNTLEDNILLYKDSNRETFVPHPFNSEGNNRFTFHSPEFHFNKPTIPFEMKVEGLYLGDSRGRFTEVKGHPHMVILGPSAYSWATALGAIETALAVSTDITDRIMHAAESSFAGMGSFNWGQAVAWVGFGLFTAQRVIYASFVEGNQNVYEWLKIFDNNGTPYNFAAQYSSVGHYNSLDTNVSEGDLVRGLQKSLYLKNGRYSFNERVEDDIFGNPNSEEIAINHYNRESALYLSVGDYEKFGLKHKPSYKKYDNSRFTQTSTGSCGLGGNTSPEINRELYAQYISLKNYIPNQHGTLNSVKWISTGYNGNLALNNSCDVIFGGDTFLSRFSLKRKFPFFIAPMLVGDNSVGDFTPFSYTEQRNVAYPRYYVDYKTDMSNNFGRFEMPTIRSYYELDCFNSPKMYVKTPSKFYMNYYGTPSFIVESRLNMNHRYARNAREGDFFPNNSDYMEWTQEQNVAISNDNEYHYNFIYSADNDLYAHKMLPIDYDPNIWAKLFDHHDRTIYTEQDNSEQDLQDNFTVIKANSYEDFGSSYGEFFGIKNLEQGKILARFENGFKIHNAFNTLQGTVEDIQIGTGGVFATRPSEFHKTPLGFGGTQHSAIASSEFGHFWVDAKRGRVHSVSPGGTDFDTISNYGKKSWFKENLPFNIKKQFPNIPSDMLDNAYNNIGIILGWDDKYSRLFLTKRDLRVRKEYLRYVTIENLSFIYRAKPTDEGTEIFTYDNKYFEDMSWTMTYSPLYKGWLSYHSFTPNYFTSYTNFFQTGKNFGTEQGAWNHLLSNKTFLTYYGKAYPFKIEYPLTNTPIKKFYTDVFYRMESRRYINEYDFRNIDSIGFDKMTIYNERESTGLVILKEASKNNLAQFLPINNASTANNDVTTVVREEGISSINKIFNNVKDVSNPPPIWLSDLNNVDKQVNQLAFNYTGFKNHFRGTYGIIRLEHSQTQYKTLFEFGGNTENQYM